MSTSDHASTPGERPHAAPVSVRLLAADYAPETARRDAAVLAGLEPPRLVTSTTLPVIGATTRPDGRATASLQKADVYDYLRLRLAFQDDTYDASQTNEFWYGLNEAANFTALDDFGVQDEPDMFEGLAAAQDRSLERPRKIDGVREYHVHNPGEPEHWILKHPERQQLMRLSPEAWFLWQRFDGVNTVRDLIFEYLTTQGAVAPETVLSIIDQARERGFIHPPGPDAYKEVQQHYAGARLRFAQKLRAFFSTKWTIPYFDEFVTRCVKWGGWLLFNPVAFVLCIPLIGYGLGAWIHKMGDPDFELLRTNDSLLLGLLTYVIIKIIIGVLHEFGQACYLKALGREVPEAGIIWYYGIPYVVHNSNDIWLERRSRRLLHSAVGPGIELVIGALAFAFTAWGVEQGWGKDILVMNIAFKVGMLACFGALFKLNPLIELNGYFMLVDIVRIPRLMRLSFYFWTYDIWGKLLKRETFTKMERTYILFGVLCIIWMVIFYYLVVVIVADKHLPKLLYELKAADAGGLLAYLGVTLLLLAPGVLSAWSYVIVWWHVFYDGTVRFFRYTSQHIVSYTLAAIAFATPFLLQLIPAVPVQNSVDDSIYRFVARLLGVIGMAGAITVWLVLFFRKMWIDRRTGRFLTWVGFAAICFGIPQGMYLWAITGSGNPRLWYDIGSTFDMLGALCLVPATLRLVGLLRTYRFGRWTSRLFGMREAFALLFTWFLFFSLGSAALAWAQANIVKERPYWAVAEINADTIRKAVKAAIEGDATHDDTMLRSGTLPDLAPWIGLDPWAFANSSFAAEDYRVIVDDRSDPRRGWRVHLESSRGGPTARLDVYADGSMHLTPGVEPWMIWKAGMWSIAIGLMIYALIVLWIHTLTMLFSSSFLPWAGFACSLSLIGLSILLHAFELASGERLDLYLVRQHYAINAGAGLILACTMLMIVVFRYQVQFRIYGDDARTPLGEAEQLRQVVSKLVWSILRNVETWFGKQRQFALRRAFEARCGDGVTIDAGELTDPLTKDSEDVVEVGRRLRTLFNRITNAFIDEFGSQLYQRALVNLHDALFWRERELAHTHIFAGAWWGVRLRHYDDAALTPAKKREIFQRIPLFTGFSEEEMVALMARFREEAFGANEVVFRPGEESDRLYIVLSGRVSIEQELDERAAAQSHRPIAELRRGDWFGEISLIKEATRAATVICLEPTTMLSLDRNTYLALADRYHAIGRKIEEAFDFLMLIDDMPVFRELTAQRIRELATSMRLRLVEPGERVVREGEPGRCFYIVRQGRFNVIEHLGDPDERHLDTLIRGDYFGELALLEDMPRSASVVALEPGELLELDRDDFERLLGKYVAMTSRSARQANRRHFESRVRKQMATRKRHQTTAAHTGGDTDPHGLHGDDRGTTVVRARHRLVDRTTRRVPRRSRSGRITAVGADGPFPSPGSSDDHIPPPAMPEMPD